MTLSEREYQLLSLVLTERTGREVAKLFKAETGKTIPYGTLYSTFKRLKDAGLVSHADTHDEDGRLRYFKITGAGAKALNAAREHYLSLLDFGGKVTGGASGA